MTSQTQLVSGLAGAIGCSFRSAQNQLVFVEYGGKLSRLNLFAPAVIVSQGSAVLKGTFTFDLDNGAQGGVGPGFDIWWEQMTAVARQMAPQNNARIVNLGVVNFNSITADSSADPDLRRRRRSTGNNDATNKLVDRRRLRRPDEPGQLRQGEGRRVRLRPAASSGSPTTSTRPMPCSAPGYTNPEDVKASADGVHAYVTERSGDLVRVALTNANRAAATVVAAGMTAPQQLFLDEAHNAAYVVEYASPGHLWRIDLTTGTKTAVVSNLESRVGVVLSADLQYAYVSEQTTGPDKGRVSRIQTQQRGAHQARHGPDQLRSSSPGLDAAQTSLLVAERDPANRITAISPIGAARRTSIASGLPARPSSVAMLTPGRMLVCSDQVIEHVDFARASSSRPGRC